jgi:hypothetical protein
MERPTINRQFVGHNADNMLENKYDDYRSSSNQFHTVPSFSGLKLK